MLNLYDWQETAPSTQAVITFMGVITKMEPRDSFVGLPASSAERPLRTGTGPSKRRLKTFLLVSKSKTQQPLDGCLSRRLWILKS